MSSTTLDEIDTTNFTPYIEAFHVMSHQANLKGAFDYITFSPDIMSFADKEQFFKYSKHFSQN